MSWFQDEKLSWLQRFAINILKEGAIPGHIAIIMDGNRRFASKKSMKQVDGHIHGFERLSKALHWCRVIGIKEVTVFAFSIENFKRSKEEVDRIMDLCREKLQHLIDDKQTTNNLGLCVRVIGNISLLPEDIQKLAAEIMLYSKNNKSSFLNICLSYTSREEISTTVRELAQAVQDGLLKPSDISESLIEKSLYTNKSEPPDLVIRTSGEVRLSDFMLWQSCYSVLTFIRVLWPEYSIWHLIFAVFMYQRRCIAPKNAKDFSEMHRKICQNEDDRVANEHHEGLNIEESVSAREERVQKYLWELDRKRWLKIYNVMEKNS